MRDDGAMTHEKTPSAVLPALERDRALGGSDAVIVALGLWIAVLSAYVGETTA